MRICELINYNQFVLTCEQLAHVMTTVKLTIVCVALVNTALWNWIEALWD